VDLFLWEPREKKNRGTSAGLLENEKELQKKRRRESRANFFHCHVGLR
jgi:hypothetical protein